MTKCQFPHHLFMVRSIKGKAALENICSSKVEADIVIIPPDPDTQTDEEMTI